MSSPKYMLPPPIYLPSSGGYTSSRLTQEPFHRRVFAYRRWSIDEDGRMVCRTRHAGRDSRPKPYDRPSRSLALVAQNGQDARATASQDRTSKVNIDGSTLGQLFQNLAPLIKEPPSGFDSKAAAICASLGLDPVTSEEIIGSFKRQFVASGSSQESSPPNHTPPASGPRTDAIAQSTKAAITPTFAQPTSAPVPSTSAVPLSSTPPTSAPSRLALYKQQRAFSSSSPGVTTWYTTSTAYDIASPPEGVAPVIGDLYIHHNRVTDIYHVWLWGADQQWKSVTGMERVYHPAIDDRVLSMRANGTPNWITTASFTTIRGRKVKARIAE